MPNPSRTLFLQSGEEVRVDAVDASLCSLDCPELVPLAALFRCKIMPKGFVLIRRSGERQPRRCVECLGAAVKPT